MKAKEIAEKRLKSASIEVAKTDTRCGWCSQGILEGSVAITCMTFTYCRESCARSGTENTVEMDLKIYGKVRE